MALLLGQYFLYANLLSEPKGAPVAAGHKKKTPFLVELTVLKELEACWQGDPSFQIVLQSYALAVSSSAAEFFATFSLIWQGTGPRKHFIQWSSPSPTINLRVQVY